MFSITLTLIGSIFIIYKSSSFFEKSSDYLSRNLSEGIKGATINAIGSSMPELITTVFFLVIMKDINGFIGGLGTSVGSAMFNILVIPSLCGGFIFFNKKLKSIPLNKFFFLRDGLFLIISNIILFTIIYVGFIKYTYTIPLILVYIIYIYIIFKNNKKITSNKSKKDNELEEINTSNFKEWVKLIISLMFLTVGCYLLVENCIKLMELTGLSIYFISIIFAGGLTSVPDAILSFKDIKKGNYSDSFTNIFGSNIFDICIAFGIPVLIFTLFYSNLNIKESIIYNDIIILSIISIIITLISIIIFLYKDVFNKNKAIILSILYILFIIFCYNIL